MKYYRVDTFIGTDVSIENDTRPETDNKIDIEIDIEFISEREIFERGVMSRGQS